MIRHVSAEGIPFVADFAAYIPLISLQRVVMPWLWSSEACSGEHDVMPLARRAWEFFRIRDGLGLNPGKAWLFE